MPALARRSARTPALDITPEYRPSLAVLPFRSLQADQADAYFAEGMVDDIIRVLAGLKELFVIARSSTLGFARAPLDLRRVGHELDVRYVLHGSVRRAGEQLRIAVELNDLELRQLIWADRFDGGVNEIFELQDRIAVRVANAVAPHVRERELVYAARKHPSSLTAYDLTLRALDHLYRMDRASFFRAHELLGEALAHDQDYAPAYSHLAYWHVTCVGQGWSQDVQGHIAAAEAAARSAIERDRNDPLALALFGHYHSYLRKDYARAAEPYPNHPSYFAAGKRKVALNAASRSRMMRAIMKGLTDVEFEHLRDGGSVSGGVGGGAPTRRNALPALRQSEELCLRPPCRLHALRPALVGHRGHRDGGHQAVFDHLVPRHAPDEQHQTGDLGGRARPQVGPGLCDGLVSAQAAPPRHDRADGALFARGRERRRCRAAGSGGG